MRHLIVYCSKYGAAEKCAKLIQERLHDATDLINLKTDSIKNFDAYDTVIIGGSIYAGKIQSMLKAFATKYQEDLCKKKLGMYILCKEEGEKAQAYIESNFPEPLVDHAEIKVHLGHGVNLEKMNFFEKTMIKTFLKIKESYSELNLDAIKELADKMNAI